LPVAAEINARLVLHDERNNSIDLEAVRIFPMILAPRHLLREPDQVRASDVVVVPDLGAAAPKR
jgi:hypothetical protein